MGGSGTKTGGPGPGSGMGTIGHSFGYSSPFNGGKDKNKDRDSSNSHHSGSANSLAKGKPGFGMSGRIGGFGRKTDQNKKKQRKRSVFEHTDNHGINEMEILAVPIFELHRDRRESTW